MHPSKAEALQELATVHGELDREFDELRSVAGSPSREGWGNSLKAAATMFVLGASAAAVNVIGLGISRIDDRHWN